MSMFHFASIGIIYLNLLDSKIYLDTASISLQCDLLCKHLAGEVAYSCHRNIYVIRLI